MYSILLKYRVNVNPTVALLKEDMPWVSIETSIVFLPNILVILALYDGHFIINAHYYLNDMYILI